MKDLKHLIYFEDLLQEANNELVGKAQKEGLKCIGYMCENVPEPLLNLPGCFSSRLRAPRTGSIDVGTYYLTTAYGIDRCRHLLSHKLPLRIFQSDP